jgi:hypothetical protein
MWIAAPLKAARDGVLFESSLRAKRSRNIFPKLSCPERVKPEINPKPMDRHADYISSR